MWYQGNFLDPLSYVENLCVDKNEVYKICRSIRFPDGVANEAFIYKPDYSPRQAMHKLYDLVDANEGFRKRGFWKEAFFMKKIKWIYNDIIHPDLASGYSPMPLFSRSDLDRTTPPPHYPPPQVRLPWEVEKKKCPHCGGEI